jgi:hypothetical protein
VDRDQVTCSGDAAHDLGIPNRDSTSSLLARRQTCKEWFPIRIFSGRPADMSVHALPVLANHTFAQVCAVCFSGVQTGALLTTKRMYCVQMSRRLCTIFAEYQSWSRPLDGRTIRTGGTVDCIWVKIDPSMAGLLLLPRSSSSRCSVSLIAP